ncbi:MAG: site-specific DNA-methyltransferase [Rhodocyclaceae bacterium]|nr:site-specific DNA-methyltransferase [Rhodocyclaceae bacterium]
MRTLKPGSVQTCVTSPPYWGLRDYGVAGQIGLEASVADWVREIVDVMREVRRVLRDDGTLWLNLGDSYVGNRGVAWGPSPSSTEARAMTASRRRDDAQIPRSDVRVSGLKPKDLVGQPWRVAFALQDDGWYLRQEIIWHKPNPMPESVRDRCTKAHETVFLLSKSERYFFDADAIAEPCSESTHARLAQDVQSQIGGTRANGGVRADRPMKALAPRMPFGWETGLGSHSTLQRATAAVRLPGNKKPAKGQAAYEAGDEARRTKAGLLAYAQRAAGQNNGVGWGYTDGQDAKPRAVRPKNNESFNEAMAIMPARRNKRSVWTVASEPFKGAHFATFPTALIEPCILAGSRTGDTVLDPFGGAGTTGLVADRLQRHAILCELNPEYAAMARRRIEGESPLFAEVGT